MSRWEVKKFCELQSGPYKVTKVITEVNHETASYSDLMKTHIVHRNDLVDCFPLDSALPSLLSNHEKPPNGNNTGHSSNKYARADSVD